MKVIPNEKPAQPRTRFSSRVAEWISLLMSAPLVAIVIFIVLNRLVSGSSFVVFTLVSILFAGILPLAFTIVWSRYIRNIPTDIPDKKDRYEILVAAILSYGAGTLFLYLLHAPWLVTGLMICYCINTVIVLAVTFVWKISIHAMGTAGPLTAIIFALGTPASLLLYAIVIPVMWSRVCLGRHTAAQVIAGAGLGIILTAMELVLVQHVLG